MHERVSLMARLLLATTRHPAVARMHARGKPLVLRNPRQHRRQARALVHTEALEQLAVVLTGNHADGHQCLLALGGQMELVKSTVLCRRSPLDQSALSK